MASATPMFDRLNMPCVALCGKCSCCIQYGAWVRRGERDYLGVEAEAALKARTRPATITE